VTCSVVLSAVASNKGLAYLWGLAVASVQRLLRMLRIKAIVCTQVHSSLVTSSYRVYCYFVDCVSNISR
jgi:hypothetical protein